MSTTLKQQVIDSLHLARIFASRRSGASETWMALVVLGGALIIGGILGIFVTGFLSFLQPTLPFLFVPVQLINYTIVPIGFVITLLLTLPILAYLAKHTHTDVTHA